MTAPDPLHTVTDSATAFEERLAFADDGAGPVLYHAAKVHVELTANVERFQQALERIHRAVAYYTWWTEQMQLIAGGGPEPTEHRDPITWEPLPAEHQCGDIWDATYTPDGIHCPHGFKVQAGDAFYVNGQECVLGEFEPVKTPCFTTPIFTAPEPEITIKRSEDGHNWDGHREIHYKTGIRP